MADRRVRYILEVDYAGGSAALTAADQLREVDDAAREAGEGLTQAEGGFSKLQAGIVTAGAAFGLVQQGFDVVAQGAQKVWGALEEGAALQDAREDFDALAESVGSAADVMLNRMGEAAGGMLTNAEMIGAASDLMLLNLGLTEGQIVDLVGVAGELEWSMDALANTLNTKSTRGLKELGLGIEDVKGRVAELTAEGHSLDEAFTLAILDAGRERIELVGGASETAAGKMVVATNAVSDYTAALKESAVASLEMIGFFDWMAGAAQELSTGNELRQVIGEYEALTGMKWETPWRVMGNMSAEEMAQEALRVESAMGMMALAEAGSADATRDFTEAQDAATAAAADSADAVMLGAGARQEYIEQHEWIARAARWVADEQRSAASADYVRARAVAELNQEMANQEAALDLAGRAAQAWAEYTAEATARGGDYFEQITQTGRAQYDLNDAIYAAAGAHGAGAGALGEIGVETEQFGQAVADAGVAAAQQQAIVDYLAGAAQSGKIAWDDYAGAVERAIELLNGLPEAKPPEVRTDFENFEGYLPDFATEPGGEMTYYAKVEIGADYLAVTEAVEEARGIVEGFASPETVYQGVLDLNITAVEEKGAIVAGIIEGLPTGKTIKVDIEVTGGELLEQLIAGGWNPGR